MENVAEQAYKLVQTLQLSKGEQSSVSSATKVQSLSSRWFNLSGKKKTEAKADDISYDTIFIERDNLITMKYKRDEDTQTVQYYRVFCISNKQHNKWFVHLDGDKIPYSPGSKKYKILVRLLTKDSQVAYSGVKLKKDGEWSSKAVYCIAFVANVTSISKLQHKNHTV